MPEAYLIYNPAAGRFPSEILAERASNLLEKEGWQVHLAQTHNGDHVTALALEAAEAGMDALFVAGGDGSLNLAARGLVGSSTALGVLPAGTANVWAQELGLPGLSWARWMALEESARQLAHGQVREVDLGWCNEQPFLLWAGVGLDAFIVHRLEPRNRWEKHFAVVQYAASAIWNASFWHGQNMKVTADGKTISGHYLLAVVSNIHLYAGGFAALSPHARLDDGVMDLWLFRGETLGDTMQCAWDVLSGRHLQSDQAFCLPITTLHLESDSEIFLQLDGEPISVPADVTIHVRSKALRVLVPAQTPHPLFVSDEQDANFGQAVSWPVTL